MKKPYLLYLMLAVIACFNLMPCASATGIPVLDASSLTQEIMTVAQTLQSNLNEASQLANQATQLANEARNLSSMPTGMLNQYLGQYAGVMQQLQSTYAQINGLGANLKNLSTSYQNMFPNMTSSNISPQNIGQQLTSWLSQAKQTYQGVYRVSGQVMDNLPQTNAQIASISQASNSASGNLEAQQAQTQMTAQLATEIAQMNGQMAGYYQAQADALSQQAQQMANSQAIQDQATANFVIPSSATPSVGWQAVH